MPCMGNIARPDSVAAQSASRKKRRSQAHNASSEPIASGTGNASSRGEALPSITIRNMSGDVVCRFPMEPSITVRAVKQRIARLKGIPAARQQLFGRENSKLAMADGAMVLDTTLSLRLVTPEFGAPEALGAPCRAEGLWPADNIATQANGLAPHIIRGPKGRCRCKVQDNRSPEMRWFRKVDGAEQKSQQYRCYVRAGTEMELLGDFYDSCGPELEKYGGEGTIWVRVRWRECTAALEHDPRYIGYMGLQFLSPVG